MLRNLVARAGSVLAGGLLAAPAAARLEADFA
jgi:hypothetical protein